MKKLAKRAVLGSKVLRLMARSNGPGAAILMYHSVMDDPARRENLLGGIVHSQDVFRQQIEMLARDYSPVSLECISDFAHGRGTLPARAVVVTFDDGYADNAEIAAPILKEAGVPAAFYVVAECVSKGILPWPARLRFAFRCTGKESWSDASGKLWRLSGQAERESAFLFACDECCKLTGEILEKYVSGIELELEIHVPDEAGALMMNFDQVRGLARQGHIVGSHTMSHPNLARVSLTEARAELSDSKKMLEEQLKSTVRHFSYPCPALPPNWNSATLEESRKAGYDTAVTTDSGIARASDDPLCWKRVRPTKTVEGLRWNLERSFAGRAV